MSTLLQINFLFFDKDLFNIWNVYQFLHKEEYMTRATEVGMMCNNIRNNESLPQDEFEDFYGTVIQFSSSLWIFVCVCMISIGTSWYVVTSPMSQYHTSSRISFMRTVRMLMWRWYFYTGMATLCKASCSTACIEIWIININMLHLIFKNMLLVT